MTNKLTLFIYIDNKIYELIYIDSKQTSHSIPNQATHIHTHTHTHTHAHTQNQPASTCGQCGKTFNCKDNMLKHLQHCTGHRPLPPPLPQQQQQQQHTTASPPMFTFSHQYSSMEVAVERYNIDMQETQHLGHLSTALFPSLSRPLDRLH